MISSPFLIDSTYADWTNPATWVSEPIDLGILSSNLASFHIYWRDVAITWYLWRSNSNSFAALSPPWDDITAAYRALDPAWVDPALGDPWSTHFVSFYNVGARYVRLGYSASNWTGADKRLYVVLYKDQQINSAE